jgi:hypothetical protein
MAFLRNRSIHWISLHSGVQAQGMGGVFVRVFLLRGGVSIAVTLILRAARPHRRRGRLGHRLLPGLSRGDGVVAQADTVCRIALAFLGWAGQLVLRRYYLRLAVW